LRKALRVKRSALPKVVDAAGRTPLVIASELGCSSYLPDLVRVGYDINARDERNLTALCSASSLRALDVVTEPLHLRADTEITCLEMEATPLMIAATNGHAPIIERLLQGGAQVNAQQKDGSTAVFEAVTGNHFGDH
jgi:ankyrin repeat protein